MVAREGFEPVISRPKALNPTTEPPRPPSPAEQRNLRPGMHETDMFIYLLYQTATTLGYEQN